MRDKLHPSDCCCTKCVEAGEQLAAALQKPSPLEVRNGVDVTLAERDSRYGNYGEQAWLSQKLKRVIRDGPRWEGLEADMRESLELIAVKISRILHGDPNHADSWHDIAGYARLIEKRLTQPTGEKQ